MGIPLGDLAAQTTNSQYNAGFREGRIAGRAEVINNPSAYGLVSRTNIPDVRFSVATNTAFAVGVGGTNWTRFAQSGAPTNWSFNTNTGVLTGLMSARQRTVRITPYSGSKAGPRMTVQFKPEEAPTPLPGTNMVRVEGGILPSASELAGITVATFYICKHEVTYAEIYEVTSWATKNGYSDLPNLSSPLPDRLTNIPAMGVTWYEAVKWCNAKSERDGLVPVYQVNGRTYRQGISEPVVNDRANGYRLPTEAEWEWAARGGTKSKSYIYSGSNTLWDVAWYIGNSKGTPSASPEIAYRVNGPWPVGTKAANELEIHDMSGNVAEWCWDSVASQPGSRRMRGGDYDDGYEAYQRAIFVVGNRGYLAFADGERNPNFGFRVARNAP